MTAPCKDCTDRHFKCHAECERYREFKKRCDDMRERERLDSLARRIEIDRAIQRKMYHLKKQHHDVKW